MGTSKRYAAAVDRQMDARVLQRVMSEQPPLTLTSDELELDREPLTQAPIARPVRAWVRYGVTAALIDAEAVEWTEHAVHVRWITPAGDRHHAWVWASAVRPKNP
ncbi:MAG: hypothetical protein ABIQ01_11240 [Pseudolysinimonas sp.]